MADFCARRNSFRSQPNMLEHHRLVLLPWSKSIAGAPVNRASESSFAERRLIVDGSREATVGMVRRQRRAALPWYQRLILPRAGLEIYEYEDEPLLFTMRRSWGFGQRWQVQDAEGHRVGVVARVVPSVGMLLPGEEQPYLSPSCAADDSRELFFVVHPPETPYSGRLFASRSLEPYPDPVHGFWFLRGAAMEIEFAEHLAGEPFTKMLWLAALLALDP